ncbi:D-alanyl-D-alanine carboxypeptidase family protein [Sporosarcina contaminans]|uniref:D-alanyl-D-alanine carboxypeptidase family protein n=1 Tax=Sporosarcina contaminans TaxID=633403 RepID=A0ABW3TWI8_9BACL
MKRSKHKKTKSKIGTIILLIISIFFISAIVWIGINEWNVDKSLSRLGLKKDVTEPQEEPIQLPEEEEEPHDELPNATEEGDEEQEPEQQAPNQPQEKTDEEKKVETPTKIETPVKKNDKANVKNNPPTISKNGGYIEGQKLPKEPTFIKGVLIANKKYPLPSDYAPGESKEARAAFDEMAAEAKLSGINLTAFSTYRSYEYQVSLYDRYVQKDGKDAADRYSARPGYSEHQTGLAFDIGEVNFEKHWASSSFGDTEAGKWVAANAYRYGFILRYPKGKEDVTGYMHESWHFRYVGKEIAEEVFKRNITLEEYLGIE